MRGNVGAMRVQSNPSDPSKLYFAILSFSPTCPPPLMIKPALWWTYT